MKRLQDIRTWIIIAATIGLFAAISKAGEATEAVRLVSADISQHATPTEAIMAGFAFIAFLALTINCLYEK